MFTDLVLIHRPGGQSSPTLANDFIAAQPAGPGEPFFFWQTCLRQIAVGCEFHVDAMTQNPSVDQILRGEDAYRFLLEVICGLHSPLVGETEVYGQFKNAVSAFSVPATPWGSQLKRFFMMLYEDAKRIRQMHLEDLGSQSYGSVLRRELKGVRRVHVLGAGQLVREILPWIAKDGNQIRVFARDPKKAKDLSRTGCVEVHAIADGFAEGVELESAEAIVIAAPVSAAWLETWLAARPNVRIVADLRADSATDRIACEATMLGLGDVFAHISENQIAIEKRKAAAVSAIEAAVRARSQHVEYRPFGWEDVCA